MSLAADSAYPVKNLSTVTKSLTTIFAQIYNNRIFVVITDKDTYNFGTLIQVKKDYSVNFEEGNDLCTENETTFDISVLFGVEKPEYLLAARIFGSKLSIEKPILFSLAIKNFEKQYLQEIAEGLIELLKSA